MIRRGVSVGLVGKHEVNLAQNLGVWFWGPEPKLQKKTKKKPTGQRIFKILKIEGKRKKLKKSRRKIKLLEKYCQIQK